MKSKIMSWLLFVMSYLTQIPFLTYFISAMANENLADSDKFVGIIVAISCIFALITLVLCAINILTAVFGFDKNAPAPYKTSMSVKLGMIPFYIINFVIWGMFIAVFLMYPPFIGFGIFILVISVISSYIIVLSTSAHNIVYALKDFKRTKSPSYLIWLICHFIFCLDVIGAIALYAKEKSERANIGTTF